MPLPAHFPGSRFELRLRIAILALVIALVLPLTSAASSRSELQDLLQQARIAEKGGNYAAAEHVYQQALALAPGDLEILKRLGVLQQTELKFRQSIEQFKQVLSRDAQFPETNFFLGVSYFGENDLAAAIHSFEQELATLHPHPRSRYYLALALQSSGRVDEAASQLNRTIAENPKDADALYQLARIYKNASVQAIERLKALDPASFQLHALMGEVYAEEQRYPEAIKEYQAALAKRPYAQGIHYAIGIAYWVQHQMEPAEQEFKEALQEKPTDPLTNLYLGDIAVRKQHFAEAFDYLRLAEKGEPGMLEVHLLLGKSYRGQNDLDHAKTEFQAAIQADPSAAQPHYLLAQIYRDLHDAKASADEIAKFQTLSKLEKDKAPKLGTWE